MGSEENTTLRQQAENQRLRISELRDEIDRLRPENTDLQRLLSACKLNCPGCNGTGTRPGTTDEQCEECGGSGKSVETAHEVLALYRKMKTRYDAEIRRLKAQLEVQVPAGGGGAGAHDEPTLKLRRAKSL